jgi:hypothetical protein
MQALARRITMLVTIAGGFLLAGCDAGVADEAQRAVVREAESAAAEVHAARVLDLADYPLPADAELAAPAGMARLRFTLPETVPAAYERVMAPLRAEGWKLLGEPQSAESSASALLSKDGWTLSLSLMPQGTAGRTMVMLQQHGNVPPGSLPKPSGATAVYEGPHAALYRVPGKPDRVADALRELLTGQGWTTTMNGHGPLRFHRRGIGLTVAIQATPDVPPQTNLSISAELLGVDIPAFPGAEMSAIDPLRQSTRFANDDPLEQLIDAYDSTVRSEGWARSLDEIARIEGRRVMTWRNAERDMLRLDWEEPRPGHRNVTLSYQSRGQIDAMNRRLDAQAEARTANQQAAGKQPAGRAKDGS